MKKQIKCRNCGKMVSSQAKRCKYCGTLLKMSPITLTVISLIFLFIIVSIIIALLQS